MNVANQALEVSNLGRALDLLNRQRPGPGQRDLRGWEWRYLWQQTRSDALFTLCQEATEIELTRALRQRRLAGRRCARTEAVCSVWDLRTRQELAHLRLGKDEAYVARQVFPTEPLLAFTSSSTSPSGLPQDTLRLWNTATREVAVEFPLDEAMLRSRVRQGWQDAADFHRFRRAGPIDALADARW